MKKQKKSCRKKTNHCKTQAFSRNKTGQKSESAPNISMASKDVFLHEQKNYFSYLVRIAKSSNRYKIYKKVAQYFRPFRIFVRVLRWVFIAFAWIQASAVLIVALALFLSVAPVIAIGALIFGITVRIDASFKYKIDRRMIDKRKVIVLFRNERWSAHFFSSAIQFSQEYVVLIVGNWFALRQELCRFDKKQVFLNRAVLGSGILTVTEHYFLFLNKSVLVEAERVFFVY